MNDRIYLSPPHMTGNELLLVEEAFKSNYIAPLGPMVDRFEDEICKYTGYRYCVALSSGTAALHLALRALGVKQGDTVWASTLTFIGSVSPIIFCGATPVFIDSSLRDWNIDCNLLEVSLKKAESQNCLPKALIVTDLYGQPCDYDLIESICSKYGVYLIADAAESLGSSYKHKKANADIAAFSFNGNKIITTSGGGALASNDKKIIDYARYLSQQARSPLPYYHHEEIGHNYRMSNILAAIGIAQIGELDLNVQKKKEIYEYYKNELKGINHIKFMPTVDDREPNYWLTVIQVSKDAGVSPEKIRLILEDNNIESRPVWKPMHLQPVFKKYEAIGGEISEELFQNGLCLPSGTQIRWDQLDKVIDLIKNIF